MAPKQDEVKQAMLADPGPVPWGGAATATTATPSTGAAVTTGTTPAPVVAVSGGGGGGGGLVGRGEELTAEAEEAILQRSLWRAEQLGYDLKKVMLVEWTV